MEDATKHVHGSDRRLERMSFGRSRAKSHEKGHHDVGGTAHSEGELSRRQFVKERPSPTGRRRGRRARGCWPCPRPDGPRRGPGRSIAARRRRAKPQSRTGGESFPPLPLPATPLRRTEKKRPPAPPALVGKMALGPIRFVRKGDKRVQYRDWMTDPADLDSLLAWTNEKLGINYGKVEADFEHFSFDPRELPALLFAGHNTFKLDDDVRQRLARYVLDGGMIIGDACCGWKDFAESFRREIEAIFPGRPLRKLHARRADASRRTTSSATSRTRRPTARSTRTPPAWKGSTSAAARAWSFRRPT